MNRNTNAHFAEVPTIDISRSKFDRSFNHITTFNEGDLIPFFCTDILPGDTVKMNTAQVVRMMTPITPVMGNANLDTYFFFVPNRLIWEHWEEFMGENKTEPWAQNVEYSEPQVVAPDGGWTKGSLADYFGYPTKISSYKASAMPFRAYAKIWNDWFRDENLKDPCNIYIGDSDTAGVDITDANYDYVTDTIKGAAPCKAAKMHDYFTSALPQSQKGPAVNVPLGNNAPIVVTSETGATANPAGFTTGTGHDGQRIQYLSGNSANAISGIDSDGQYSNLSSQHTYGLAADLSKAIGATVDQIRTSFQIQKFYERQARSGTRYIEILRGHFRTTNPDFRMQRAEYMGGIRTPININQVVQTDATSQQLGGSYVDGTWTWNMSDLSPQGNTAAYSLTSGRDKDLFTHSFTEHGWLIGLAVVRIVHSYQQGLNRMFSRKSKFDYYWPEFAHLGEQAILNKEIYLDGSSADEEAFGYQERYAEYRYLPDIITGEMRSNYDTPLDIWHWGDNYAAKPTLGSEWIDEPKTNIQRTLAVQDHDQFMGDFYFNIIMTRPMPLFSVPGLIDHF